VKNDYIADELYMQILDAMPIACVDVAIIHDGRVLLVQRKDAPAKDQWWLPGGRVQKGETLRDAARRKALEETGLACVVDSPIMTAETMFEDGPQGTSVHSINTVYRLAPHMLTEPQVVLDGHHANYEWVDAIPKGVHRYVRTALEACGLSEEPDIGDILND